MKPTPVRFPIRRKLYALIGVLFVNLAAVICVGVFGMWLLSAMRAYVGGEGLWAKAQKNAIYSLSKYALSRDEKDYRDFQDHLKIPMGDKKARMALELPVPDSDAFAAGWVEGGNSIDDASKTENLFRRFHFISYIGKAIGIWREADTVIAELQEAAEDLHQDVLSGNATKESVRQSLRQIDEINVRLTALENDFSYTLGEASRWASRTLLLLMLAVSVLFGSLSLYASLTLSDRIASGIRDVAQAAAKVAGGDLTTRVPVVASGDEIESLSQAFNEMSEGLAKLEQMKNDFISTVSHELRTPLTLTLAPLETLLGKDPGAVTPEQRELLEVMHNNTVRLLQMVSGLLDFSKLEAGKVEVVREPTDLPSLTRGIVDDFRPIARAKRQAVSLETEGGAVPVGVDRYLYERILFNLLSNAVKFTPDGGRIAVRLRVDAGAATLWVRDSGIGIARDDQERLFQRFRQLESSSSRRFEGTGLGLALVKEFSELLGGGVTVESAPGKGSEFRVAIQTTSTDSPAAPREEVRRLVQRFAAAAEGRPDVERAAGPALYKVLIAEDNEELAVYLKNLLKGFCAVRHERDGEQALMEALEWQPDLILSDVMMPKMDGLELCRRVKADRKIAGTPVILLTALTQRDAMAKGWEAGADEYLFKPFHPKEVVTRVQYMLESFRARRLAQKDLEAFNYSVAHDLRGPLRKIAGYAMVLEQRLTAVAGPEVVSYARKVQDGVGQLDGLITGLLRLSRVEQHELTKTTVDLSALAEEIGGEMLSGAPGRSVQFHAQPGIKAEADAEFIRIALHNLIENAWKFSAKNPAARIEFGMLHDDRGPVYFVRDDGAGFDMAHSAKLFGAFKRLHAPGQFPGNGIGLATARRAIHRHGGAIWAEAAVDKGATFFFTLGLSRTTAPAHG